MTIFNVKTHSDYVNEQIYTELSKENEQKSFESIVNHGNIFGLLESNLNFNKHVYNLFNNKKLKVLEIGCGGGQVVMDFINDGHEGLGIDLRPGYNLYKDYAPNWKNHPNTFCIADAGKDLEIVDNENNLIKFDLITSWECFEHIYEGDIIQLMSNIEKHSKKDSYFIGSISLDSSESSHRCVKHKSWWFNHFAKIGYINTNLNFGHDVPRFLYSSDYFYLKKII